jgi:hypothetical protein
MYSAAFVNMCSGTGTVVPQVGHNGPAETRSTTMKKLGLLLAAVFVSGATLSSATFAQDHRHGTYKHHYGHVLVNRENHPSGGDAVLQAPFGGKS